MVNASPAWPSTSEIIPALLNLSISCSIVISGSATFSAAIRRPLLSTMSSEPLKELRPCAVFHTPSLVSPVLKPDPVITLPMSCPLLSIVVAPPLTAMARPFVAPERLRTMPSLMIEMSCPSRERAEMPAGTAADKGRRGGIGVAAGKSLTAITEEGRHGQDRRQGQPVTKCPVSAKRIRRCRSKPPFHPVFPSKSSYCAELN